MRFEDAPSMELLWSAASRAKLNEEVVAPVEVVLPYNRGGGHAASAAAAADAAKAEAATLKHEEAVVSAAKAAAVAAEDFVLAQELKIQAVAARAAAEAAEAKAAETMAVASVCSEMTVAEAAASYRESNPVLAKARALFEGRGTLEDLDTTRPSSGQPDPMARAFLGDFFAGLYLDCVEKNEVQAATRFRSACTAAEQRGNLGFAGGAGGAGGILEALAATEANRLEIKSGYVSEVA